MEPFNRAQYQIPPAFPELLKTWTREVLRYKPDDIITFSRDYFANLEEGTLASFLETLPQNGLRVPENTTDPYYPGEVNGMKADYSAPAKAAAPAPSAAPAAAAEEELPDLATMTDADTTAKITKIQAMAKGKRDRKIVEEKKAALAAAAMTDADTEKKAAAAAEAPAGEAEELPDLASMTEADTQKITKIQAMAKGKRDRKLVEEKKAAAAATAEEAA